MERKTRLPTIGRLRSERSIARQADSSARREAREELSLQVQIDREDALRTLCDIAEDVTRLAQETHRYINASRSERISNGHSQRAARRENRGRVRMEAEQIVTSDFRL